MGRTPVGERALGTQPAFLVSRRQRNLVEKRAARIGLRCWMGNCQTHWPCSSCRGAGPRRTRNSFSSRRAASAGPPARGSAVRVSHWPQAAQYLRSDLGPGGCCPAYGDGRGLGDQERGAAPKPWLQAMPLDADSPRRQARPLSACKLGRSL